MLVRYSAERHKGGFIVSASSCEGLWGDEGRCGERALVFTPGDVARLLRERLDADIARFVTGDPESATLLQEKSA